MKFDLISPVKNFVNDFFNRSGIHGFLYLGNFMVVHIFEKIFWLALICTSVYFSVDFSLESWDRYLHKSTVVAVSVDHYYWNTSLPSITICPMERLSREKFDSYVSRSKLTEDEKEEFFVFLESLANSSYMNFQNIKSTARTDELLKEMRVQPSGYLKLIYDLTEDLTRRSGNVEQKVRNVNNMDFIRSTQILTEYGICYTTNNILALNLSTALLIQNKVLAEDPYYRKQTLHDVRYGNLFDGDMTYSFIGFTMPVTMYLHSPYETMNIARSIGYTNEAFEFEAYSIEIIATKQFMEDTFISQRGCRFNSESNLTHYSVYSKNLCLSDCRANIALERCGCIPHFYPNQIQNPRPVCSYRQLMSCFPEKKELFLEFHDEFGRDANVNCNCLQNCVGSNVIIEKYQHLKGTKQLLGSIGGLVIMKKYPLIRFQRGVIFTLTDFFVSIGGTAGFFLGASVLGLIEIVYFFSLRLFWFCLRQRD